MKTVTYICDICKKSVEESDLVSIDMKFGVKAPSGYYLRPQAFRKDGG